jgi:UDP:flavonoid glycosyltransferase YjiC (YdhE family)
VRRKLHQILEHQSYRDHATQISTALKQTNGLEKGIEVIETFLK